MLKLQKFKILAQNISFIGSFTTSVMVSAIKCADWTLHKVTLFDLVGPCCQKYNTGSVKHLTCKPCSCCRSSGCGYRTWTGRRARWWRRSRPEPPRWWCPGSPVGSPLWSVGETPLISERLIKKRAGGRLESHRNFTLVHWRDNEGSLDGNIAKGGFELRHTHSHQVIRLYAVDRDSGEKT